MRLVRKFNHLQQLVSFLPVYTLCWPISRSLILPIIRSACYIHSATVLMPRESSSPVTRHLPDFRSELNGHTNPVTTNRKALADGNMSMSEDDDLPLVSLHACAEQTQSFNTDHATSSYSRKLYPLPVPLLLLQNSSERSLFMPSRPVTRISLWLPLRSNVHP